MDKPTGGADQHDVSIFRREVLRWHPGHSRSFPWRESQDPYEVLIGEVLLQRTRGEHVVAVYRDFLKRWPNAEKLSRARVATIETVIYPLGLMKRAAVLKHLGRAIVEVGEVPTEPEHLLALPGIGPYGAHGVPVFALNHNLPLVDWVIARVLRRYFGLDSERRPNTDKELWDLASKLADLGAARELWLGVLDLGALVCKRRPLCTTCPLRHSCTFSAMERRSGSFPNVETV